RCALELNDTQGRLLGPSRLSNGARSFGGAIRAVGEGPTAPFVGRERTIPDGRLANLKLTPHWPQSISVLSPRPEPEKGEPHGAATLLRVPWGVPYRSEAGQLRISWA